MRIVESPLGFVPGKDFTGKVNLSKILEGADGDPITLYRVKFESGARTDWHAHQGLQVLYVESGTCRIQKEHEPMCDVHAGNVIVIDADEKHWHGAAPGEEMVHIAIGLYQTTAWFEPVSDDDYQGNT